MMIELEKINWDFNQEKNHWQWIIIIDFKEKVINSICFILLNTHKENLNEVLIKMEANSLQENLLYFYMYICTFN